MRFCELVCFNVRSSPYESRTEKIKEKMYILFVRLILEVLLMLVL
jgi:hypothetical protein